MKRIKIMGEHFPLNICLTILCLVVIVNAVVFRRQWCNYLNPNGVNLYMLSLEVCKQECGARSSCQAVDYFRREQKCSILLTADGITTDNDKRCVHVRKEEIKDLNSLKCSDREVSDTDTMYCTIKECFSFGDIPNGVVLGNMGMVGARLKTECVPGYQHNGGRDISVCEQNGQWSYRPECNKTQITNSTETKSDGEITNATEKSRSTESDCGNANTTEQWHATESDCGDTNTTEQSLATEGDHGDANTTEQSRATEGDHGDANTTEQSRATESDHGDANTTEQSRSPESDHGDANTTEQSHTTKSDNGDANTTEQSSETESNHATAHTIGKRCTTDDDCGETMSVCIDAVCFCSSLYRYNTARKDCVKVCSSMTDDFIKYPSTAIKGYNMLTANAYNCEMTCKMDPDCLSYELTSDKCRLGSVSYEMATDADSGSINNPGRVTLFSRNCNKLYSF